MDAVEGGAKPQPKPKPKSSPKPKPKPKHAARVNDEPLVFLDENLGNFGPMLVDDQAPARAAELTNDREAARELAIALAHQPEATWNIVDHILAGRFPAWVIPKSTQTVATNDKGVLSLEGPAEGPLVGDGHDVRLADGSTFHGAPGDGVAVASVDFDVRAAPPPGPRKPTAKMTRQSLMAAMPTQEAVAAAAISAAAQGGQEASDAILGAYNGICTVSEKDRGKMTDALGKWATTKAGVDAKSRRLTGSALEVLPIRPALGIALDRSPPRETKMAPEPMGDPEGKPPPECGAVAAAAQPIAAVRAFARWMATAKRDVRIPTHAPYARDAPSHAIVKETTDPIPAHHHAAMVNMEIKRAHAFEFEGVETDDAFDDAPDPLTAPPNRGEIANKREAALEREYRARSRDPSGVRWPAHEAALRDGMTAFPGVALDMLEAALVAERVLATKAAKYARKNPEATRADIEGVKLRQAPVHALAALAALALRAGIPDAVRKLEPLMGGDRSVAKAFVDTIDIVPELHVSAAAATAAHPRSSGRGNPAKSPAAAANDANSKPKPSSTPAQTHHVRVPDRRTHPLIRFNAPEPASTRRPGRHPESKKGKASDSMPKMDVTVSLDVPTPTKLTPVTVGMATQFAALTALMTEKKKSDLVASLLEQDAAWLDHVARHRIPLLMPDPTLRALLVADAASRPPLPPHFDAVSARKACAFDVARVLHLPSIALQLGGRDITVDAVRAAFARAHAFARAKESKEESNGKNDKDDKEKSGTFPAPKMRTAEYARFEETTLMPWLERALRTNAPTISALKTRMGELRRENDAKKDAALDALDPERYRGIIALQRIGAFDEEAFDRLVAENEADNVEAASRPKKVKDENEDGDDANEGEEGDDDGYAMEQSDNEGDNE